MISLIRRVGFIATYIVCGQVVPAGTAMNRLVGAWVTEVRWQADFYKISKTEVHFRFQERAIDRLHTMVTLNV